MVRLSDRLRSTGYLAGARGTDKAQLNESDVVVLDPRHLDASQREGPPTQSLGGTGYLIHHFWLRLPWTPIKSSCKEGFGYLIVSLVPFRRPVMKGAKMLLPKAVMHMNLCYVLTRCRVLCVSIIVVVQGSIAFRHGGCHRGDALANSHVGFSTGST
jgi:hypothetical protein